MRKARHSRRCCTRVSRLPEYCKTSVVSYLFPELDAFLFSSRAALDKSMYASMRVSISVSVLKEPSKSGRIGVSSVDRSRHIHTFLRDSQGY